MNRKDTYWNTGLIFILAFLPFAIALPAVQPTLWVNGHHTPELDLFFKWYTQVGEWPIISAAIFVSLAKNWKTGIIVGICFAIESLLVNGTKLLLNIPRPRVEVGVDALHPIQGVVIHSFQSFPSGHTAAAFIGFGIISTFFKQTWIKMLCALFAVSIAYSRLYLGQHYLRDVLASACIALMLLRLFDILNTKFNPNTHRNV